MSRGFRYVHRSCHASNVSCVGCRTYSQPKGVCSESYNQTKGVQLNEKSWAPSDDPRPRAQNGSTMVEKLSWHRVPDRRCYLVKTPLIFRPSTYTYPRLQGSSSEGCSCTRPPGFPRSRPGVGLLCSASFPGRPVRNAQSWKTRSLFLSSKGELF